MQVLSSSPLLLGYSALTTQLQPSCTLSTVESVMNFAAEQVVGHIPNLNQYEEVQCVITL